MSSSSGAAPAAAGRTMADRALGLFGGAMVVFAVVLLLVGGPEDGAAPVADAPEIELVQPRNGITLNTDRLHVVFQVEGDFGPKPGGWGTDSLHLHLNLNGTELMPASNDIERLQPGVYRWTLARPSAGLHTLQLFWSDPDHRPIQGASSRAVQIQVK